MLAMASITFSTRFSAARTSASRAARSSSRLAARARARWASAADLCQMFDESLPPLPGGEGPADYDALGFDVVEMDASGREPVASRRSATRRSPATAWRARFR